MLVVKHGMAEQVSQHVKHAEASYFSPANNASVRLGHVHLLAEILYQRISTETLGTVELPLLAESSQQGEQLPVKLTTGARIITQ